MDKQQADAIARALMAEGQRRQDEAQQLRLHRRLRWQRWRSANRRALLAAMLTTAVVFLVAWGLAHTGLIVWPWSNGGLGKRALIFIGLPVFVLARWRFSRRHGERGRIIEL